MSTYERIRPMFADVLGVARSKYIPIEQFEKHNAGTTNHCMTLFAQHYDKSLVPGAPGSGFFEGMPDVESRFDLANVRPGWDAGVGVVLSDLYFHDEPYAFSPRAALKSAIQAWQAKGLEPMIGMELEAYICEPDGTGGWRPATSETAMTYGVGPLVDRYGLVDDVMAQAKLCGLKLESVNSEYDSPQFEFTLRYSDALQAADDTFLFRQMAMEVAAKRGLRMTFLGKPLQSLAGSGLHVNFSLARGTPAGSPEAKNALVGTAKDPYELSTTARHCIAGLLEHHHALTALCAPTVNSYKRLRPGQMAGVWANWGIDHRFATVRIPAERGAATRIEHRLPCGSANPYLAITAILRAALLGVSKGAEPPDPETGDALVTANTERRTASNLASALDDLEANPKFIDAVGRDLVDNFVSIKRGEWDKFCEAVTDWEIRYYSPFI
jgi:glutamine synthetase